MSALAEPPPVPPPGQEVCDECGFPLFLAGDLSLYCIDCGRGPLCRDCYEDHVPRERER